MNAFARSLARTPCLAVLLAACTTIEPEQSFADVEHLLAERGVPAIHWNLGTDADRQVAAKVDELLERELTAETAVQIALLNNRRLQATYQQLGIAQAHLVEAGLLRNPVFHGEVRFAEGGTSTGFELSILQPFLEVLFLPLRKRLAATELEVVKLRVTGTVLAFAGEVRRAFYSLQGTLQLLELRQTTLRAAEASYELAVRMHAAGNLRDLDLAQERALVEQSRLELATAEAAIATPRERLNALLGLWAQRTAWRAAGRLPPVPGEEVVVAGLETRAIARSVELAGQRRGIEFVGEKLGLTREMFLLDGTEVGAIAAREPGDGLFSAGPSVVIPLPIWNRGTARVRAGLAELRAREEQYAATAVEIRAEARALAQALLAARAEEAFHREVLIPLRHRLVEETQLQVTAMQIGAFLLLQAKREEIEAGRRYVEALRDYWLVRAELEQLQSGQRRNDPWADREEPARRSAPWDGAGSGERP